MSEASTPTQEREEERAVRTEVIGHRAPRYPGEPKSRREIHKLLEPLTLRDHLPSNTET